MTKRFCVRFTEEEFERFKAGAAVWQAKERGRSLNDFALKQLVDAVSVPSKKEEETK